MVLPYCSVVADVLGRDGLADERSYSPFIGCKHFVFEILKDYKDLISLQNIISLIPEFEPEMRLEDVEQEKIESYVIDKLVIIRKFLDRTYTQFGDISNEQAIDINDEERRKITVECLLQMAADKVIKTYEHTNIPSI